jgi:hypothetical protein
MAARARGLEPIARGWLVRHGADGAAHEEVVTEFDTGAVEQAMVGLVLGERQEMSQFISGGSAIQRAR